MIETEAASRACCDSRLWRRPASRFLTAPISLQSKLQPALSPLPRRDCRMYHAIQNPVPSRYRLNIFLCYRRSGVNSSSGANLQLRIHAPGRDSGIEAQNGKLLNFPPYYYPPENFPGSGLSSRQFKGRVFHVISIPYVVALTGFEFEFYFPCLFAGSIDIDDRHGPPPSYSSDKGPCGRNSERSIGAGTGAHAGAREGSGKQLARSRY